MSSRHGHGKYQKHGYLIEEICQTYPDLSEDLEEKMLEFRTRFPSKYRDWYYYELVPALEKLQQMQAWSHSTTPVSQHNVYPSRQHDQSYRTDQRRRERYSSNRSQSRTVEEDTGSDSCYKRFHLPHIFSTIISNRCVLFGEGKHFSVGMYPTNAPESQYITNLEQLKELIPFEDKKCFYEYLQTYIDLSTHLSEKLLYQLVLLHLKFKYQTEPNDVAELLLNEYKKIQGEQFLKYSGTMSREKFMSQPQDSLSTDNNLSLSREQFISQDLTRDDYMSQSNIMSRDQFIAQDDDKTQDEDKILHRLRKLLLNGSKHKALRWAIENQEWVSALFIASSMDEATYMNVCSKYIESIPRNDPLRTCLQVQFGLEIDYQYSDDWGVHLAAILNNTEDARQILKFANILGSVKDICGQHFCFISGRIQPSSLRDRNSLYTLVGTEDHLLADQIPIQSVMLTMAYDNTLPHLQYFKYHVALNYIKMGSYELGLCLLQNIAVVFLNAGAYTTADHYALASYVYDLSLRIYNKVHNQHITWISSLGELINSVQPTSNVSGIGNLTAERLGPHEEMHMPQSYDEPTVPSYSYMSYSQDRPEPNLEQIPMVQYAESISHVEGSSVVTDTGLIHMPSTDDVPRLPQTQVEQTQPISSFYVPSFDNNLTTAEPVTNPEVLPPVDTTSNMGTISLHSKFTYAEDKTDSPPQTATANPPPENKVKETPGSQNAKSQAEKPKSSGKEGASSWLSFLKFARPKNQMILPDDNKPSIVWDEDKKMWVDVNSDGKPGPSALPPPPKMPQLSTNPAPLKSHATEPPASMSNNTPAPTTTAMSMPLTQPMNKNQNGYRKAKAKYVNVLANNS